MPSPGEKDQWGNIYNAGGYWEGVGENAGQYYYGGKWHDLPPLGSSGGSSGVTYDQQVDTDGSVTGVVGAVYQRSSNGAVSIISRPSTSGGGGSTSYTTIMSGQLGANRYTTYEDSQGNIWQVDNLDGSRSIVQKAPSSADPRDKNGDGIDDTSNLAVGVFKDDNSSTGYAFYGPNGPVPVYPTGEDATKRGATYGGGGNDAPDFQMIGGVPYIWDGTKLVPAPGAPRTATSSSSGGSGTAGLFTPGRSTSSGGGSSRDYIGEISAKSNADMAYLDKKFALEKQMAELEFAYKNDPNNPDYVLRRQQLALQAQQLAHQAEQQDKELKRAQVNDFRSAVNDVDPNAVRALLYGQGMAAGGNLANRLKEGGSALSPNALAGAAALLEQMRIPASNPYAQWLTQMPGLGAAVAPTASGQVPTGMTGGVPGAPASTGAPQMPGLTTPDTSHIAQNVQQNLAAQTQQQAQAREAALYDPTKWTNKGTYYQNTVTGDTMTIDQYNSEMQAKQEAEFDWNSFGAGASVAPNYGGVNASSGYYWKPVSDLIGTSTGNHDALGQLSGTTQYISPDLPGFAGLGSTAQMGPTTGVAQPFSQPYGDDNIQREIPADNKVVIPGLTTMAHGGFHAGPAIVGDPQRPGVPNPELVQWTPRGNVVMPLGGMQAMQGLSQVPRFAWGTSSWTPWGGTTTTQPTPTPMTPTPAPAPVPVAPAPAPQPAPVPVATQPTPATPAGSTATNPQPTSTPSTSSTPASPPATTAPATGSTPAPAPTLPGLTTLSGGFDTTALTPAQQALLDEVRQFRESGEDVGFEDSLYSLDFQNAPQWVQQGQYLGLQTKKGIPAYALQEEVEKARRQMPGLSFSSIRTGL